MEAKHIVIYVSIITAWLILAYISRRKKFGAPHIITVLASSVYSLSYDSLLGEYLGLYHYADRSVSIPYMILTGVLLYPLLNLFYLLFLPEKIICIIQYAAVWIVAMLAFEALTIAAGSVVFTGWNPVPWSVVTYIVTYLWITLLFRSLTKAGLSFPLS